MGEQPERTAPSSFAMFLRFIAIVTVVASFIVGYQVCNVDVGNYISYHKLNEALYAVYIIVGVLSGIGWWALSYIVDACIKYLNKD